MMKADSTTRRRGKRRVSPDTQAPEEPQAPYPSLDAEIRPRRPDEPPEPEAPEAEPNPERVEDSRKGRD